jgi:hypothetical protein
MSNNLTNAGPELVCADCGAHFRARRVTDGVEEICDKCYEARFPTPAMLVPPQRAHARLRDYRAAD